MLFLSFVLRFVWSCVFGPVVILTLFAVIATVFPFPARYLLLYWRTYTGAGTGTGTGVCRSNRRVCPLLTKPLPISTLFCSYFRLISRVLWVLIFVICVWYAHERDAGIGGGFTLKRTPLFDRHTPAPVPVPASVRQMFPVFGWRRIRFLNLLFHSFYLFTSRFTCSTPLGVNTWFFLL
jgi:hypothetical protein